MDLPPPRLHNLSPPKQPIRLPTRNFVRTESSEEEDVYKPLSSPNTETSEFDEIYSSPSTRSGHPSGSSATPERFLYLQDSSESEGDVNGEVEVHGTVPIIDSEERTANYGGNNIIVILLAYWNLQNVCDTCMDYAYTAAVVKQTTVCTHNYSI